jgi:hypothetical protein
MDENEDLLDRELGDLIRSMLKDLNPDVPLEQRIATYGKVISGLLQRHGGRITKPIEPVIPFIPTVVKL